MPVWALPFLEEAIFTREKKERKGERRDERCFHISAMQQIMLMNGLNEALRIRPPARFTHVSEHVMAYPTFPHFKIIVTITTQLHVYLKVKSE